MPHEPGDEGARVADLSDESTSGQLTITQLETDLLGLGGQQIDRTIQVLDELMQDAVTAEQRARIAQSRVRRVGAIIEVTTGPNAIVGLLDMVVLTTVLRDAVETRGESFFGMNVDGLVAVSRAGERDAWTIAGRVLSDEQQAELRTMIDAWLAANPDQIFNAETRFRDLPGSELRGALNDQVNSGGMLGIDEATRAIDEIRGLGERALLRARYAPTLVRWEAITLVNELLAIDEVRGTIRRTDRITESIERLSRAVEEIPEDLRAERIAAIEQVADAAAREREATVAQVAEATRIEREAMINQLMEGIANERLRLLEDLDADRPHLRNTLGELRLTLEVADALVDSLAGPIETLAALRTDDAGDGGQSGIEEYGRVARDLGSSGRDLKELVESLDALLRSEGWDDRMPQLLGALAEIEQQGERLSGNVFRQGVRLIVVLLVGLLVVRLLHAYLARTLFGGSDRR